MTSPRSGRAAAKASGTVAMTDRAWLVPDAPRLRSSGLHGAFKSRPVPSAREPAASHTRARPSRQALFMMRKNVKTRQQVKPHLFTHTKHRVSQLQTMLSSRQSP